MTQARIIESRNLSSRLSGSHSFWRRIVLWTLDAFRMLAGRARSIPKFDIELALALATGHPAGQHRMLSHNDEGKFSLQFSPTLPLYLFSFFLQILLSSWQSQDVMRGVRTWERDFEGTEVRDPRYSSEAIHTS